jgi:hypothetical protein
MLAKIRRVLPVVKRQKMWAKIPEKNVRSTDTTPAAMSKIF